jgi:uncharacterized membrane protein
MYIPLCFVYIIPVGYWGWFQTAGQPSAIAREHLTMSHRPFIVMGALDCLATTLQVFAAVYLPGHLLVLLPQVAIPLSLVFSRWFLREQFRWTQYLGALVVLTGVLLVLEPLWTQRHAPDFYCQVLEHPGDDENDNCLVCQIERSEGACLSHRKVVDFSLFANKALGNGTDTGNSTIVDNNDFLCQWIPFEEATLSRHDDLLVASWSFIMILACVPLTLSTVSQLSSS